MCIYLPTEGTAIHRLVEGSVSPVNSGVPDVLDSVETWKQAEVPIMFPRVVLVVE